MAIIDADGWIGNPEAATLTDPHGTRSLLDAAFLDRPIPEALAAIARAHPNRIACEDGARVVHFGDLFRAVGRLATHMLLAPGGPGPVGILLPFGAAYLAAVYACVAAGRPCVLLDAGYPPERIAAIIGSTGLVLLVVDARTEYATPCGFPSVTTDCAFYPYSANPPLPMFPLDVDAPAFILHTSGSTGQPKAFALSQRGALHRAAYHVSMTVNGPNDRMVCLSSPSSVGGLFALLAFPLAGVALQFVDLARTGFGPLLNILRRRKVTILRAGPPVLRSLAQLPGAADALASLHNVTTYGETLMLSDVALLRSVLPARCRLLMVYGSTESPGTGWFASADDAYDPVCVPAGTLQPGVEAMIVDDDGAPVPVGVVGELLIRSRFVALGEWRAGRCVPCDLLPDPSDPTKRIHRTGDLARRTADGVFVIAGRKDRMVQINGQRVEPAEIEAALRRHPMVNQAAVVTTNELGTIRLHAFVVMNTTASTVESRSLRLLLRQRVPTFMVPATITQLEELPLLPCGKVDQKALVRLRLRLHSSGRMRFIEPLLSHAMRWARSVSMHLPSWRYKGGAMPASMHWRSTVDVDTKKAGSRFRNSPH